MNDPRNRHPHDLSSRGFRRGGPRGRGHDSPPQHGPEMEGPNQRSHPFLNKLSSRGLRVVLKECMKIGILAGEDPQMSPLKEGVLKSDLVRSVYRFIFDFFIPSTCLVHEFISKVLSKILHSLLKILGK